MFQQMVYFVIFFCYVIIPVETIYLIVQAVLHGGSRRILAIFTLLCGFIIGLVSFEDSGSLSGVLISCFGSLLISYSDKTDKKTKKKQEENTTQIN